MVTIKRWKRSSRPFIAIPIAHTGHSDRLPILWPPSSLLCNLAFDTEKSKRGTFSPQCPSSALVHCVWTGTGTSGRTRGETRLRSRAAELRPLTSLSFSPQRAPRAIRSPLMLYRETQKHKGPLVGLFVMRSTLYDATVHERSCC